MIDFQETVLEAILTQCERDLVCPNCGGHLRKGRLPYLFLRGVECLACEWYMGLCEYSILGFEGRSIFHGQGALRLAEELAGSKTSL